LAARNSLSAKTGRLKPADNRGPSCLINDEINTKFVKPNAKKANTIICKASNIAAHWLGCWVWKVKDCAA
jgi:hypothetical protein